MVGVFDCGPTGRQFESASCWSTLTPHAVVHDWVIKVLGMSSRDCATGHIKDPIPLIERSTASCPGVRCPNFIHQVIIITGFKGVDVNFSSRPMLIITAS